MYSSSQFNFYKIAVVPCVNATSPEERAGFKWKPVCMSVDE
jgi:hypothetical protein